MDFWKTLTVTFIGFVLTGVVGTWISYFWQTRNWRHQQEYLRNRELLAKQIEIVEDLSNMIGQRRFRMFRAAAVLRSLDKKRIDEGWSSYDAIVVSWNDRINGFITKIRQFFSQRIQYDLDVYITDEIRYIGSLLERAKRKFDSDKIDSEYYALLKEVSGRIERFSGFSNEFIGRLWAHIDGLKEKMDGKPAINFENRKSLSYFYLIKHIFVPRKKTQGI